MRYFFSFVVLIHGLIHLQGFAKAFGYAKATAFAKEITTSQGSLWLVTALLIVVSGILFVLQKGNWWYIAFPAILISQVLIIHNWKEAKFGSIANLIILAAAVVGFANARFNKIVKEEVAGMLPSVLPVNETTTLAAKNKLPLVVEKWLKHSGADKSNGLHTAHLYQKGKMITSPGGKWLDFTAEEYFNIDAIAFNWKTKVRLLPGVFMTGRDHYEKGKASMFIKLFSIRTLASTDPSDLGNRSSLVRFLAEICWFPTAASSEWITWGAADDSTAMATIQWGGQTATGTFFFTKDGDVAAFEAMRHGEFKGQISLEKWRIEMHKYQVFSGIRIPVECDVTWKLKSGDFTWLQLALTGMEYNITKPS
jgi:hypothetical protein